MGDGSGLNLGWGGIGMPPVEGRATDPQGRPFGWRGPGRVASRSGSTTDVPPSPACTRTRGKGAVLRAQRRGPLSANLSPSVQHIWLVGRDSRESPTHVSPHPPPLSLTSTLPWKLFPSPGFASEKKAINEKECGSHVVTGLPASINPPPPPK